MPGGPMKTSPNTKLTKWQMTPPPLFKHSHNDKHSSDDSGWGGGLKPPLGFPPSPPCNFPCGRPCSQWLYIVICLPNTIFIFNLRSSSPMNLFFPCSVGPPPWHPRGGGVLPLLPLWIRPWWDQRTNNLRPGSPRSDGWDRRTNNTRPGSPRSGG